MKRDQLRHVEKKHHAWPQDGAVVAQFAKPELAVNFLTHVWEEMVGCSMGCRVHVQALWASYVAAGTKSTHSHRFAFV